MGEVETMANRDDPYLVVLHDAASYARSGAGTALGASVVAHRPGPARRARRPRRRARLRRLVLVTGSPLWRLRIPGGDDDPRALVRCGARRRAETAHRGGSEQPTA